MPDFEYCIHCIRPLRGHPRLAWICSRTLDIPVQAPVETTAEELDRDQSLFGPSAHNTPTDPEIRKPGGGLTFTQDEQECGRYNPHNADTCTQCKGPRHPEFSAPACPHPECQEELPMLSGVRSGRIVITGPSVAGKSLYIVALEDWWNVHLGSFGIHPSDAMGKARRKQFDEMHRWVVDDHRELATNPRSQNLSFCWNMAKLVGEPDNMLITIHDRAGEDLEKPEVVRATRHFHHARGIILILDGERIAAEHRLDNPKANRAPAANRRIVETMIRDLTDRKLARNKDGQFTIPVAVCVNKMNYIEALEGAEEWKTLFVDYKPDHSQGFDWQRVGARSEKLWQLLIGPIGNHKPTRAITDPLNNLFESVVYFPITIGLPGDNNKFTLHPVGIEDPFLWLLHIEGFIP